MRIINFIKFRVFLLIYLLIPLYNKIISIEFYENLKDNFVKIIKCFFSNKSLLAKIIFYTFQAYLCFSIVTDINPRIKICKSLIDDFYLIENNKNNNTEGIYINLCLINF